MKTVAEKDQHLDCIAMKRSIQTQIAAETKGMTPRQRLAYYTRLANESPFATLTKRHHRNATST
jgi:hypothetical protein